MSKKFLSIFLLIILFLGLFNTCTFAENESVLYDIFNAVELPPINDVVPNDCRYFIAQTGKDTYKLYACNGKLQYLGYHKATGYNRSYHYTVNFEDSNTDSLYFLYYTYFASYSFNPKTDKEWQLGITYTYNNVDSSVPIFINANEGYPFETNLIACKDEIVNNSSVFGNNNVAFTSKSIPELVGTFSFDQTSSNLFGEIFSLLPVLLVLLVSFIALRKGIRFITGFLRHA